MKLQNQLSIKSALRFALPCLASCLLLAACSNEVSDVTPDDLPSEPMGTVRFSASAPFASEDVTTRIGIGSDKPTVDQWENDEPIIWLGDEEISVFFVPKGGGSDIHAKFIIDSESISDDGKSADLINVTDLGALNGEYEIYAFTPYVAENTLSAALLDFSNQVQLPNTTTYGHLGVTASMRAEGGEAQFTNGSLVSGDVTFNFEHITSFLRFNITNELGEPITVTSITVSHPNMISKSSYSIEDNVQKETITASDISLTFGGGQSLADGSSFDAYMSTLNVPLNTNFDQELEITISVTDQVFTYKVLPSVLQFSSSTGMFNIKSRFLFDISLVSTTLPPPDMPTDYVEFDGYYYTYNHYATTISPVKIIGSDVFVSYDDLPVSCPFEWELVSHNSLPISTDYRLSLYIALGSSFFGSLRLDGNINTTAYLYMFHNENTNLIIYSNGFWSNANGSNTSGGYRPICRKKI